MATMNQTGGEGGLTVRRVRIDTLHADPANVNRHPEANLRHISDSLKTFGQVEPLVVQKGTGKVIGGNGRLQVLIGQGVTEVDVVELDIDDTKAAALGIALNRSAKSSEFDDGALAAVLATLPTELQLGAGFDMSDLRELESSLDKPVVEDEPPAPLPEPVSKRGDIWTLGSHRLMCGDSTDGGDVALVMNGERADASITDPPYSVNYEESHKTRGGDKTVHGAYHEADIDPTDLLGFLGVLPCDLIIFSYSVNRHMFVLCKRLEEFGWEVRKELIWVKDSFSFWMGAAYQQRHEPIWICTRNSASFRGTVDSKDSTVFEYPRPSAHDMHPTAKPVELWAKLIGNHIGARGIAFEPFSGSGTTIIACEQLGRRCYAIEIEPRYVDVAVRRWQKLTSKDATLDGKAWKDVAAERGVKID